MALTTTQVNAAYVALLGRAAEGNANAWAENSADTKTLANTILSVDGKFKNWLEQAKTNADFVEALYKQVLGRNSDADGKAFWVNTLANGTSRDELKANFLAAAKANNEDLSAFDTSNQQFLSDVYSALLNRSVDSSGLEHWMNLLNNGTSRAEVVANIIEAINANKASDDYAIYNAKMSVANAVTKVFAGPKAGLNAEQSKALNDQLVSIMSSVTSADVTEESIKAQIENVVGSYGKEAAPLTFKAVTDKLEDYELGNAESTTAQTFRGTINLQDDKKSTINGKAKLNTSKFSDTLVVDVIPSIDGTAFDYSGNANQVKTFASGDNNIKNLTINNGTAKITNLDNKGITENLKITGAADVTATVSETLNYLEVNTGGNANAKATITVNADLKEYVGKGSGKDEITVSGAGNITVSTINTGAGDDKLTLNNSGAVIAVDLGAGNDEMTVSGDNASIANATINLGAGNDKFTFNSGTVSGATINGGTGTDTIVLSGDASAIKSLTSFEKISISENSNLSLDAFNGNIASLGTGNLSLGASQNDKKLTLDASNATTIDLSKVEKDAGAAHTPSIELTNVGSGANSGVTVTLNKDDGIEETIKLAADVGGDGKAVTITGIGKDDKLDAKDAGVGSSVTNNAESLSSNATITANKLYFVQAEKAILTGSEAYSTLSTSLSVSSFTSSSAKAVIAFNYQDKAYIFAANGNSTDSSLTESNLTLVGIVDNNIDANDKAANGIIEFA